LKIRQLNFMIIIYNFFTDQTPPVLGGIKIGNRGVLVTNLRNDKVLVLNDRALLSCAFYGSSKWKKKFIDYIDEKMPNNAFIDNSSTLRAAPLFECRLRQTDEDNL